MREAVTLVSGNPEGPRLGRQWAVNRQQLERGTRTVFMSTAISSLVGSFGVNAKQTRLSRSWSACICRCFHQGMAPFFGL